MHRRWILAIGLCAVGGLTAGCREEERAPVPASGALIRGGGEADSATQAFRVVRKGSSMQAVERGGRRYPHVPFPTLSGFFYSADPELTVDQIPDAVDALAGQPISVRGFMWPVEGNAQSMVQFALLESQLLCCFGVTPKLNEWILVECESEKGFQYYPDRRVTVCGDLEIGPVVKNGKIESLYRLKHASMVPPK
ncbi:MAG: hypothetical protein IT349_20980 [Candidatus Eisenbacteria bacterium]|nr:hypothetical protein [Candidatus Eisenbacteria bacterium]